MAVNGRTNADPIDGAPGNEAGNKTAVRGRPWVRPALLLAAVAALLVLARVFDLGERLRGLEAWIDPLGPWGPVAFVAIYIVATVLAVPGMALTLIAGGLFGSVVGVVCVSAGSTLGAAFAFLVARYMARKSVSRWLAGSDRFRKLDTLTERYGGWMVAITRLVPLFPFNLVNYGFGLTRVRFWTYVFWSWLCMLPGTILYVVGGDAIVTGVREQRVPWVLVGIVAVGLVVLAAIGYVVKRKIGSNERDQQPEQPHDHNNSRGAQGSGSGAVGGRRRDGAGSAPAR